MTYQNTFCVSRKPNHMQDLRQHISVLKGHGYSQDEAVILIMRLQLIKIIKSEVSKRKWTQREAAKILGVSQPRIAEISALATEKFSVETLVKYLLKLGLNTSLSIKPGKHYVKPKRQKKTTIATPKPKRQAGKVQNTKKAIEKQLIP